MFKDLSLELGLSRVRRKERSRQKQAASLAGPFNDSRGLSLKPIYSLGPAVTSRAVDALPLPTRRLFKMMVLLRILAGTTAFNATPQGCPSLPRLQLEAAKQELRVGVKVWLCKAGGLLKSLTCGFRPGKAT